MKSNLNSAPDYSSPHNLLPRVFSQSPSPSPLSSSTMPPIINTPTGHLRPTHTTCYPIQQHYNNNYKSEEEFESLVERDRRRRLLGQSSSSWSSKSRVGQDILPVTSHSSVSFDGDHSGTFDKLNSRMNTRVERLFHPLRAPISHHRQSGSNHGSKLACNPNHNAMINNHLRNNKREAIRLSHRGSMEDDYLRQSKKNQEFMLMNEANLQSINEFELNNFLEENEEYDADYDEDENENFNDWSYDHSHNRHRYNKNSELDNVIMIGGDRSSNDSYIDCAGYANISDVEYSDETIEVQRQLEEMLRLEEMELEELTKNLNLNG